MFIKSYKKKWKRKIDHLSLLYQLELQKNRPFLLTIHKKIPFEDKRMKSSNDYSVHNGEIKAKLPNFPFHVLRFYFYQFLTLFFSNFILILSFTSFLSWESIFCFQNWHGNMNFKMKKYQGKPTNCREFDAYKYRLAAILFVSGQICNIRPRMKKIFMDYENS